VPHNFKSYHWYHTRVNTKLHLWRARRTACRNAPPVYVLEKQLHGSGRHDEQRNLRLSNTDAITLQPSCSIYSTVRATYWLTASTQLGHFPRESACVCIKTWHRKSARPSDRGKHCCVATVATTWRLKPLQPTEVVYAAAGEDRLPQADSVGTMVSSTYGMYTLYQDLTALQ